MWVNGQAVPDGSNPEGLKVRRQGSETGKVSVEIGESETRVDLKIGQSFDRGTGEVRDSLNGGEVKINRQPVKRPSR